MATKKETKSSFEREYVIPLRKGFRNTVQHKKAPRAIRTIMQFLERHTKTKNVKLGMHLNEFMWKHGIKNPPPRVKVKVHVKDGVARAELSGKDFKGAVVAQKKKEPQNLKEKIEAKLGADEPAKEEAPKHEHKAEAHKPATEAPKAAPKKKSAAKKENLEG
jgi:large subunit ribosomal protein L31e